MSLFDLAFTLYLKYRFGDSIMGYNDCIRIIIRISYRIIINHMLHFVCLNITPILSGYFFF
nr:MAG TPA: hypothetical protein [Caudoviricetes sp.]